jgi:hypothetical protein
LYSVIKKKTIFLLKQKINKTNFCVEVVFQHIQIFESVSKKILNRVKGKSGNKKSSFQKNILFIYWYRYQYHHIFEQIKKNHIFE